MRESAFKLALVTFLFCNDVFAKNDSYLKTQYAGEIGQVSMGLGKKFKNFISLEFLYGVVSEDVNTEKIETFAVKNHYEIWSERAWNSNFQAYLGLGAFHVPGKKYQTAFHSNYPNNYYSEASLRGMFYYGLEYSYKKLKSNSIYFENGINDIWLINFLNIPEEVRLNDHAFMALGWNFRI